LLIEYMYLFLITYREIPENELRYIMLVFSD